MIIDNEMYSLINDAPMATAKTIADGNIVEPNEVKISLDESSSFFLSMKNLMTASNILESVMPIVTARMPD